MGSEYIEFVQKLGVADIRAKLASYSGQMVELQTRFDDVSQSEWYGDGDYSNLVGVIEPNDDGYDFLHWSGYLPIKDLDKKIDSGRIPASGIENREFKCVRIRKLKPAA